LNEKTKLETDLQKSECQKGKRGLIVFCGFLMIAIMIGGYYCFLKHDEIEKMKESLQRISSECELVKDERDLLEKELSKLRKTIKNMNFQETLSGSKKH